jgi:hypothetical protein
MFSILYSQVLEVKKEIMYYDKLLLDSSRYILDILHEPLSSLLALIHKYFLLRSFFKSIFLFVIIDRRSKKRIELNKTSGKIGARISWD